MGVEYPVIVVPPGVQVPVVAKRDLVDTNRKTLIRTGSVYFRTLAANGILSTSVARPEDWPDIMQICFDNREADIGRFLRRQLSVADRGALTTALQELGFVVSATTPEPTPPSLQQRAKALLLDGEKQFRKAIERRAFDSDEKRLIDALSWQVALVAEPGWPDRVPDDEFLATVLGSNPRYTGWPVWLDSRSFRRENSPRVIDKAWEAFVVSLGTFLSDDHLDFMRLEPSGRFFLHRALQDDLNKKVRPGSALDPFLVILRVAEAIAVGISMTRALAGEDQERRRLGYAFRWKKLANRELRSWADPMRLLTGEPKAHDDEVTTFVELSTDTPISAIAPFVSEATRDLFATFGGYRVRLEVIEDLTQRLIERRPWRAIG